MDLRLTDNNVVVVVLCLATMTLLLSFYTTEASPGGPPVSTQGLCSDMTPQHGGSRQTSPPPYTITSAKCYTPGQSVTVRLSANDGSPQYKGFFVQARKPNIDPMSYGTFDVSGNTMSQPLNCFGQTNNAVGHNSNDDKSEISFQWTADPDQTGDLEFVATVVQSRYTYWVRAVKRTIQPCTSGNETVASVAATSATTVDTTTSSATATNVVELFAVNAILLLLVIKLVVGGY